MRESLADQIGVILTREEIHRDTELAGRVTLLTLVILAQIVITLAVVGWLSRNPIPTAVAPKGGRWVTVK